jgi:hypothetical protein
MLSTVSTIARGGREVSAVDSIAGVAEFIDEARNTLQLGPLHFPCFHVIVPAVRSRLNFEDHDDPPTGR